MVIVEGMDWFGLYDYCAFEGVYDFEWGYPSFHVVCHTAAQFGDGV